MAAVRELFRNFVVPRFNRLLTCFNVGLVHMQALEVRLRLCPLLESTYQMVDTPAGTKGTKLRNDTRS